MGWNFFVKISRGAEEQGNRGEFSPLRFCPPAPLLFILAFASLTACTASSAATEPAVATAAPAITVTLEPAPQVAPTLDVAKAQVPTSSPAIPTPTFSPQPTSTATLDPTSTPTSTLTPSPTPAPSLRQLTSGGCCVQPSFSPDSRQILFIDKPGNDTPAGVYGVDITNPQPTPVLVNNLIGFWNFQRTMVATLKGDLAVFTNITTSESWMVNTGGNWPTFSPDSSQIIWVATDREGPYDRRQNDIWLANLDGSNARKVLSLYGGGLAGWFPDGQRILLVGRDNPNEEKLTLFVYNLNNEQRTNLFSHKRLRGGEISAEGNWIAFFIAFADDPAENGLWVIRADGTSQHRLDIPRFGAYAWRNDDTLLYIPMRPPDEKSMQVWAIEAATGQLRPLTDPATLSFSISNGDWEVSPDGQQLVFVNSADQNIWLITLP